MMISITLKIIPVWHMGFLCNDMSSAPPRCVRSSRRRGEALGKEQEERAGDGGLKLRAERRGKMVRYDLFYFVLL